MNAEEIRVNYELCRARVDEASRDWGRVEICAVTKTQPPEAINAVYAAGARIIGENRVQEAREKFPALNPDFCLHIIGQLQTNKVKYVLNMAKMVQSLDRMSLAQEIDRRAQEKGIVMPVLIQVNIGKEPQKGGIAEDEMFSFARDCARLPGIKVSGLMAVMPATDEPETLRPLFRRMRGLFDALHAESIAGIRCDTLSMGMSDDYVIAAQEGATMVRLGCAIFGKRTPMGPKSPL